MNDNEKFITEFKLRRKKFAVDIISLCDILKATKAASVVTYQIIKSATSVGALISTILNILSFNYFIIQAFNQ